MIEHVWGSLSCNNVVIGRRMVILIDKKIDEYGGFLISSLLKR